MRGKAWKQVWAELTAFASFYWTQPRQGCLPKRHKSALGAVDYKAGEEEQAPGLARCPREEAQHHHHCHHQAHGEQGTEN